MLHGEFSSAGPAFTAGRRPALAAAGSPSFTARSLAPRDLRLINDKINDGINGPHTCAPEDL
ncbi:hypothetical protein GCM10010507_23720 [Streptomyces cinnamoneus]|uniref:Uncharacterized protein n=1 Tax=Streptomyces cinnamoneus TaxID=53446 RepID=A0A918WIY7_STRCJ|nr:hypothetical protein GCM10010507_23720 [Streptomyces cinnamoneus]